MEKANGEGRVEGVMDDIGKRSLHEIESEAINEVMECKCVLTSAPEIFMQTLRAAIEQALREIEGGVRAPFTEKNSELNVNLCEILVEGTGIRTATPSTSTSTSNTIPDVKSAPDSSPASSDPYDYGTTDTNWNEEWLWKNSRDGRSEIDILIAVEELLREAREFGEKENMYVGGSLFQAFEQVSIGRGWEWRFPVGGGLRQRLEREGRRRMVEGMKGVEKGKQ